MFPRELRHREVSQMTRRTPPDPRARLSTTVMTKIGERLRCDLFLASAEAPIPAGMTGQLLKLDRPEGD
jgi:hypothetical protein